VNIEVVSLFPEMIRTIAGYGVVGRAIERGLATIECRDPRAFTNDPHRTVDDRPYGGGPGMVMKYQPLADAITVARDQAPKGSPVICLSPQGPVFDQAAAGRLAALPGMILVAGRYEGIDERLLEAHVDEELSLGDFVLSGGEIAAMAVIDAVVRHLPGALKIESADDESFASGLLDAPHFSRPELWRGHPVPAQLLSGHHAQIERWPREQALARTARERPDLIAAARAAGRLDERDEGFLRAIAQGAGGADPPAVFNPSSAAAKTATHAA